MTLLLALLMAPAHGASLDNLEVGGPWGTPTAVDATAVWWNPAGLAADKGTRFMLEGAPTLASVEYDRSDPYGYEGTDIYKLQGVVPFLGVATDATVKGLGLGLALYVPFVRGGEVEDQIPFMDEYPQDGPVPPEGSYGRYHLREGHQQKLFVTLAAAYEWRELLAFGAGVSYVDGEWAALADTETLTGLRDNIEDQLGTPPANYNDSMIEDPHYAATLEFEPLKDQTVTFNVGVRVKVVPDTLAIGVSYVNGFRLNHTGGVTLHFNCPPESDALGRFGAQSLELCYATLQGNAEVGYNLPSRVSAGVMYTPVEKVRTEVMGGWVGWSKYTDFDIVTKDISTLNEFETADPEEVAHATEQTRKWARANKDSFWVGVDVKVEPIDPLLVGARVIYDRSAIPDEALGPNNYDADALMLTGLAAVKPVPQIQIGLSYTYHWLDQRVVSESGFGVTLEPTERKEDRWFYPQTSGVYSGTIHRIGVQLRGEFGKGEKKKGYEEEELNAFEPRGTRSSDEEDAPDVPGSPTEPTEVPRPPGGPGPTVPPPE